MNVSTLSDHRQRPGLRAPWLAAASLTVLLLGAVIADRRPAAAAPPACWDGVFSDVDGGGPDAVIGMPSFDLPGKPDAGAIVVFSNVAARGSADPRPPSGRTLLTADDFPGLSSQSGGRFGAAVSVWGDQLDDPDHCADLLVGAPGQTVGGQVGAGQLYRLRGAAGGLDSVVDTFDESGVSGGAQAGAGFGTALGVLTSSLIAVGAPGRDIGRATDAGRVILFDYELPGHPVSVLQQGDDGAGSPESGDRFGETFDVAGSGEGPILAVGVPHEDIGSLADAGAVALKTGQHGPLTMISQNSPGAGGVAEAGDRYGSSVDLYDAYTDVPVIAMAIGVPGEDVGRVKDAGSVAFGYADLGDVGDPADTTGLIGQARTLTQNSPGITGTAEAGDLFGNTVLAGEFGHESGHVDLVVTAPLEDLNGEQNAGSISMAEYDAYGVLLPDNRPASWSQDSPQVAGAAERGDRFATDASAVILTRMEDDDDSVWFQNLVTVPREDVGGVVDAGMAYLGFAPGAKSVALTPPVSQRGAGLDMAPMRLGQG